MPHLKYLAVEIHLLLDENKQGKMTYTSSTRVSMAISHQAPTCLKAPCRRALFLLILQRYQGLRITAATDDTTAAFISENCHNPIKQSSFKCIKTLDIQLKKKKETKMDLCQSADYQT